jgi:hypothetical protein
MLVKQAVKLLNELDPDENIIISWWTMNAFESVSEQDWPDAAEMVDKEMDWTEAHWKIEDLIETEFRKGDFA